MPDSPALLHAYYNVVIKTTIGDRGVPLLSAGANLCSWPEGVACQHGKSLPNGGEIAAYWGENLDYPSRETPVRCLSCNSDVHLNQKTQILVRVFQYIPYIPAMIGTDTLYVGCYSLFNADYLPPLPPQFFATFHAVSRHTASFPIYHYIGMTKYDGLLEPAFQAVSKLFAPCFLPPLMVYAPLESGHE
jgi:hypothetical protein